MSKDKEKQQLWQHVLQLNQHWLDGRPQELATHFHPDAVMIHPGFENRSDGRDALVESYAEYCRQAATHEFVEEHHHVDIMGDIGVVAFEKTLAFPAKN